MNPCSQGRQTQQYHFGDSEETSKMAFMFVLLFCFQAATNSGSLELYFRSGESEIFAGLIR